MKIAVHLIAAAIALIAAPSPAQTSSPVADVSEARLRETIDTLVGFGTRHTLSDQASETRGIGAARRWTEGEFRRISAACGGCIELQLPEEMIQGTRVPTPTRLVNVIAIQRGSERPDEVVIISGHIDSRVTDPMDSTSDAPGANDDGSGTAAVIEAARVLSRHRFPSTIVYAVLSGEEQGLYGGRLLARHAATQGWIVKAVLNNDIIGGSRGSDGLVDDTHVRVFSEGARADSSDALRAAARREGGENDSPSRNLSRWIAGLMGAGVEVRQIFRSDRFGRGGDQMPMLEAGYPAVRLSAAIEDYDHQHQDLRVENGVTYGDTAAFVDFAYLARVTRLNVAALSGLARAPMPPAVTATGAVSNVTNLRWSLVNGAVEYLIYRRRTDAMTWEGLTRTWPVMEHHGILREPDTPMNFPMTGIRIDDWIFGVSSLAADGSESPIASAVPGGAFAPLPR